MIHVSNMQHYVTTCDHFNPTVQTVHEVDEVIDLPEKKQLLGPLRRLAAMLAAMMAAMMAMMA